MEELPIVVSFAVHRGGNDEEREPVREERDKIVTFFNLGRQCF